MKSFDSHIFNYDQCQKEVSELEDLLSNKSELSEKYDLSPFFKSRKNLVSLIGHLHPGITKTDKYAHEYDIFGDFASDFTVGDSRREAFCFIELEDARKNSIFKNTGRATSDWSDRFEHGYSQIIDWTYKIDDTKNTKTFMDRFSSMEIDLLSILIVGRCQFLDASEKRRLRWRERNVVVGSMRVLCLTYDELLRELKECLGLPALAIEAENKAKTININDL
jgi:hypothetical protein